MGSDEGLKAEVLLCCRLTALHKKIAEEAEQEVRDLRLHVTELQSLAKRIEALLDRNNSEDALRLLRELIGKGTLPPSVRSSS